MKLLRLYFFGFILSLEVCFPIRQEMQEEIVLLFEDQFDCLFAELITTDFVQENFLLLQA
jgi:hypothetical protein